MNDITRINRLLDHVRGPWAHALLRAMRRRILDGNELSEMNRSALDRMERLFLTGNGADDAVFKAAAGISTRIKTRGHA